LSKYKNITAVLDMRECKRRKRRAMENAVYIKRAWDIIVLEKISAADLSFQEDMLRLPRLVDAESKCR
jgi:RNase P protein component